MIDLIELQGRRFISAKALAKKYGINQATIFNWRDTGKLPQNIVVGAKAFFDVDEVERYFLNRR